MTTLTQIADVTAHLSSNPAAALPLLFGAGVLTSLTPCVYPMIPFTVSFFTNQGGSRAKGIFSALLYGFSIIAIYTAIGLLFSGLFGIDSANAFSTHWLPNLLFFSKTYPI